MRRSYLFIVVALLKGDAIAPVGGAGRRPWIFRVVAVFLFAVTASASHDFLLKI